MIHQSKQSFVLPLLNLVLIFEFLQDFLFCIWCYFVRVLEDSHVDTSWGLFNNLLGLGMKVGGFAFIQNVNCL